MATTKTLRKKKMGEIARTSDKKGFTTTITLTEYDNGVVLVDKIVVGREDPQKYSDAMTVLAEFATMFFHDVRRKKAKGGMK